MEPETEAHPHDDIRSELTPEHDQPKLTVEDLAAALIKMHEHFTAEIARLEKGRPVKDRGTDAISAEDRALFEDMGYRKVQMRMQIGRLSHRLIMPAEEWLVEQDEKEEARQAEKAEKEKADAAAKG